MCGLPGFARCPSWPTTSLSRSETAYRRRRRRAFRFLERFKLTASWDDEGYTRFWREKSVPWQYGRLYVISIVPL